MLENATIPFTIIKENVVGNNQYEWTKTLHSQERLNYLIKNINILQEPTETLNMTVTFSYEMKSECVAECEISCSNCRRKIQPQNPSVYCNYCYCQRPWIQVTKANCRNKKGNIFYDLRIDFHNYLHEFSSSYSYEVVCKIPRVNKPDEYLFACVEPRLGKTITFKKCYVSMACNDTFNFSSSTLYFGIRRLNNFENGTRVSALLSIISTLQNMDDKSSKVILRAKDGQITAHTSVLSQYSDVFRAMFAHEMKEKQGGVVEIPDVEVIVVEKMVDYLYTGKLENITGMTEELFKVAHRYQIQELCRRCEEYYIFNVQPNNNNIVEILQLVDLYELEELKNSAEKFVRCHEKVLTTLPRYQKYLCESVNIAKATGTLISADKYNLKDVKTSALEFIKRNFDKMVNCDDFLKLFNSNPDLMKEVYIFSFRKNV